MIVHNLGSAKECRIVQTNEVKYRFQLKYSYLCDKFKLSIYIYYIYVLAKLIINLKLGKIEEIMNKQIAE